MDSEKVERGKRIREARKVIKLNQTDFGEAIGGFTSSTISAYESGDSEPKPETFIKISEVTGVSLIWIMTAGGPMLPKKGEESSHPDKENTSEEFSISEMLTMASKVLESSTVYKPALAANIRAFHKAVTMEEDVEEMKEKMDLLLNEVLTLRDEVKELRGEGGTEKKALHS